MLGVRLPRSQDAYKVKPLAATLRPSKGRAGRVSPKRKATRDAGRLPFPVNDVVEVETGRLRRPAGAPLARPLLAPKARRPVRPSDLTRSPNIFAARPVAWRFADALTSFWPKEGRP